MTTGEVDELSLLLGEIKARLGVIEEQQRDERLAAQQHRSDLRIIIASQSTATQTLSGKVETLSDEVREMKKLTDDYQENRAQARGAAKVVLFFRALILFMTAVVGGIVTWLAARH